MDSDLSAGLWDDCDRPETDRKRVTRDLIQSLIADVADQWRVPTSAVMDELARSIMKAMAGSEAILGLLADAVAKRVVDRLHGDFMVEILREHGVRLRREKDRILASPAEALTPDIRDMIRDNKEALLSVL